MYLNKEQAEAINTAIHIMSTALGNGLGEDHDEVSEATDVLIRMVSTAKQANLGKRRREKCQKEL